MLTSSAIRSCFFRKTSERPPLSSASAVVGLRDGVYRKLKLADFDFPAALDAPPAKNPRRMVNGLDGTDKKVAGYHRGFFAALTAGSFRVVAAPAPSPELVKPVPVPIPVTPRTGLAALVAAILNMIKGWTK